MSQTKHQETIERDRILINILKKGETMTSSAIDAKLGFATPGARMMYMHKLMKEHKEIQNISPKGKTAEYKWVEDKPVKKDELVEVMPGVLELVEPQVMTPTLIATQETGKILPGEVWQTEESNGTKGMMFALNSLNGACQGIKLYPDDNDSRAIVGDNAFTIDILGRTYIGDPTHVTFKPLKYCVRRRLFTHTDKLKEAREALAKVFGIPKQEVIKTVKADPEVRIVYRDRVVEKEPEKKEEVKVPDTYVDCRSAYIVTLERELDIWKKVAMKLLDKNS